MRTAGIIVCSRFKLQTYISHTHYNVFGGFPLNSDMTASGRWLRQRKQHRNYAELDADDSVPTKGRTPPRRKARKTAEDDEDDEFDAVDASASESDDDVVVDDGESEDDESEVSAAREETPRGRGKRKARLATPRVRRALVWFVRPAPDAVKNGDVAWGAAYPAWTLTAADLARPPEAVVAACTPPPVPAVAHVAVQNPPPQPWHVGTVAAGAYAAVARDRTANATLNPLCVHPRLYPISVQTRMNGALRPPRGCPCAQWRGRRRDATTVPMRPPTTCSWHRTPARPSRCSRPVRLCRPRRPRFSCGRWRRTIHRAWRCSYYTSTLQSGAWPGWTDCSATYVMASAIRQTVNTKANSIR